MNKKLVLFFALSILLVLPVLSLAIAFAPQPGSGAVNIQSLISEIISILWWIFLGIIVIMFIIAGILFLTAQGSEDQLGKAKKAVIWGGVGVFVAILGYSAFITIQSFLL